MNGRLTTSLVLLALLTGLHLAATQSAEEVINRYVAVIGGQDALAAIETMRYVRTVLA